MGFVKYEQDGFVGVITINRPEALNALNTAVIQDLDAVLDSIDLGTTRVLVVTGAGEKSTKLLESSVPGCHGVLFLPYITGERFPVIDPDIRGAYYGITPDTSAEDLTRACLEGVAFSVRQGLELIDCEVKSVSLIGGGARVAV